MCNSLIIDIAPFPNGSVPAPQLAAASALGEFVKQCYTATPVATMSGGPRTLSNNSITIAPSEQSSVGAANLVDRVQIRENQTNGQFIRSFKLSATLAGGSSGGDSGLLGGSNIEVLCPTRSSSIGNKFICILPVPLPIASLTLHVTDARGGIPVINQFAAFKCGGLAAEIDARWEQGNE